MRFEAFLAVFFAVFLALFFALLFELGLGGTFFPSRRASERPIAIACFLLVTFLPLPPDFNVPRFRSCMALSTFLLVATLVFREVFVLAAIVFFLK